MGNLSQPIDKQFQSNSTSEGIKRAKCIAFGLFFSVNSKETLLPNLALTPGYRSTMANMARLFQRRFTRGDNVQPPRCRVESKAP